MIRGGCKQLPLIYSDRNKPCHSSSKPKAKTASRHSNIQIYEQNNTHFLTLLWNYPSNIISGFKGHFCEPRKQIHFFFHNQSCLTGNPLTKSMTKIWLKLELFWQVQLSGIFVEAKVVLNINSTCHICRVWHVNKTKCLRVVIKKSALFWAYMSIKDTVKFPGRWGRLYSIANLILVVAHMSKKKKKTRRSLHY